MSEAKNIKIDWDFIGKAFECRLEKRQLESVAEFIKEMELEFGNVPENYEKDNLAGVCSILCQILNGKMIIGTPEESFEYLKIRGIVNESDREHCLGRKEQR